MRSISLHFASVPLLFSLVGACSATPDPSLAPVEAGGKADELAFIDVTLAQDESHEFSLSCDHDVGCDVWIGVSVRQWQLVEGDEAYEVELRGVDGTLVRQLTHSPWPNGAVASFVGQESGAYDVIVTNRTERSVGLRIATTFEDALTVESVSAPGTSCTSHSDCAGHEECSGDESSPGQCVLWCIYGQSRCDQMRPGTVCTLIANRQRSYCLPSCESDADCADPESCLNTADDFILQPWSDEDQALCIPDEHLGL